MATAGLFVIGTDTEVGKTWVTATAARESTQAGRSVGVYKPACSGSMTGADDRRVWSDVETLSEAVGGRFPHDRICPQRFHAPLAPPVAAVAEGTHVDPRLLRDGARWWDGRVELLLIEGVGGLLCPLTEVETVADLAGDLGFPLLVVARLGLGTINHTLMTVEVAQKRGLQVAGIVLNQVQPSDDASNSTNPDEIGKRCDVPVLGVVAHGARVGLLRDGRPIRMDWLSLARGHC